MTRARRMLLTGVLSSMLAISAGGCATVPAEAPALSAELGGRIKESRTMHQEAVRLFMDAKRAAVDQFIMTEWVPVFARQLFDQPAVQAEWDRIVKSQSAADRVEFITGLGTRVQKQINQKRTELVQPLDKIEQDLLRALDDHYNEMLAMNSSLTALLSSGATASEMQKQILTQLKLESPLQGALQKAEQVSDFITAGRDSYQQHLPEIEELLKKIESAVHG